MSNEARAEANRRWGTAHEYGMSPQFQAGLMDGFMAGAEWAASPERLAERDAETRRKALYEAAETVAAMITGARTNLYPHAIETRLRALAEGGENRA